MILYPSIHLKDGAVARLTRGGDVEDAGMLSGEPSARAAQFAAQKFSWLHVVDLDGAFEGKPVNTAAVEAILKSVAIPVQLSGGIRNLQTIEEWLMKGIKRVVLTTMAVEKPELAREACRKFPDAVAVKIDAHAGQVALTGWLKTLPMRVLDLALKFEESGAAAIIYADINRDGALAEINHEAVLDLAFALTTPVIAAGGINSLKDIETLKSSSKAGVAGIILGRALSSGKIKAEEALKLMVGG